MTIDKIWIGNGNLYKLTDFRDAMTGDLESDVVAFGSLCERPPTTGGKWRVEGASNDTPILITSTAHGLVNGDQVTIINVGDNRGAHGTFSVNVMDADHFELVDSVGTADWTIGGQFFRCVPDCAGLPYSAGDDGQYYLNILGNVGLVEGRSYTYVAYCTGAYRDLFNEVTKVTAQVRGSTF
jgi:hypothetical protein